MAVMETWKHGDSFASVDRSTTFLLAEGDLLSATANGKRGSLRLVVSQRCRFPEAAGEMKNSIRRTLLYRIVMEGVEPRG